jgi:nucleotide-binding universal stress UspA family protein
MAGTDGSGPILLAYDGSEQAKAAIREAAVQLGTGREAIVLIVFEPLVALPLAGPAYNTAELEEGIEAEARRTAREGAELARSVGFEATALAQLGSPVWRRIVETADDRDASIVVMGSHGRTGIPLVLLGSVASAVSRHTDRPVLIVHAPPAERAAA